MTSTAHASIAVSQLRIRDMSARAYLQRTADLAGWIARCGQHDVTLTGEDSRRLTVADREVAEHLARNGRDARVERLPLWRAASARCRPRAATERNGRGALVGEDDPQRKRPAAQLVEGAVPAERPTVERECQVGASPGRRAGRLAAHLLHRQMCRQTARRRTAAVGGAGADADRCESDGE